MSSAFHRKLVEESTDIATVIEPDGTIAYASPSVEETLGYEPEELVGEVGYEYQHPDDREAVADAIETLQADSESVQVIETRFRRADGSWCWIEATLQDRREDEDIGGILVCSRDISERKRRDEQYRVLAEEYETLLETVEDGIFFVRVEQEGAEPTFRFERVNRAYEEQTGITTEEISGETPADVFGDELGAELEANYQRCVATREPVNYQEELPVETGARFWQTNLAPVVTDDEVSRIIGITRNVTERTRRERQLQSQKEQLEEFAGVVSHDLRNPLNVAQARAELLREDCESEHLPHIVRALDRMEELISDTLTLARQGQVVAEEKPVSVTELVGGCWKAVSTGEATIQIEDETTIHGDRSRLQHVFENLFRNAIDHGGPEVTVRVGRFGEDGLYVEDNGPGIPEAERAAVFEPGHSSASEGTGFGLTIVKRIAEAHGWEVEVGRGRDGGARFEFTGLTLGQQ
ncbi:MAG: PAS domain S-box protein [Haloarculaceae archaeon]